jgi:ATP-dependent helicase/DNAse subunit B
MKNFNSDEMEIKSKIDSFIFMLKYVPKMDAIINLLKTYFTFDEILLNIDMIEKYIIAYRNNETVI